MEVFYDEFFTSDPDYKENRRVEIRATAGLKSTDRRVSRSILFDMHGDQFVTYPFTWSLLMVGILHC